MANCLSYCINSIRNFTGHNTPRRGTFPDNGQGGQPGWISYVTSEGARAEDWQSLSACISWLIGEGNTNQAENLVNFLAGGLALTWTPRGLLGVVNPLNEATNTIVLGRYGTTAGASGEHYFLKTGAANVSMYNGIPASGGTQIFNVDVNGSRFTQFLSVDDEQSQSDQGTITGWFS